MKFKLFIFLSLFSLFSCKKEVSNIERIPNPKEKMRDFVIGISKYAKSFHPSFYIIPQNGIELVNITENEQEEPSKAYLDAIDANGQEDLRYGFNQDDLPSPKSEIAYLSLLLNKAKNNGKTILVTDYCSTPSKMDIAYAENKKAGYISFAASERELNAIPTYPKTIFNENNFVITSLKEVKNFLYLINPEKFITKEIFIKAIAATNYDLLIMDFFFQNEVTFSANEMLQLKKKANGGKRLVISYLSIGEAENYRYYWQKDWKTNKPIWLDAENPDWAGNYKVKYWMPEWQQIIFGNDNAYIKKIIEAGFDGAYLDIIDAYEFYE